MHKGVILLVKAHSREEATEQAKEFMEGYKDNVWDWFVIGGRWSGSLQAINKEFNAAVREKFPPDSNGWYSQKFIDDNKAGIQQLWESFGGKGTNPWSRYQYNEIYRTTGEFDDVLPLEECLPTVKDWLQDPQAAADEEMKKAEERWGKTSPKYDPHMFGYCMEKAGKLLQQAFCFDCNVYNVESSDYGLPEENEIEDFFAAMIDMHNKGGAMPQCRACKAEIVFLKTAHGKTIPVNAAPNVKPGLTFDHKTMTAHFATCPAAASFRKGAQRG